MPSTSVEWSHVYGGDFALGADGDIVLAEDSLDGAAATEQRLVRLALTNPRAQNATGDYSPPDDLFNPDWGIGMRVAVGEPSETVAPLLQRRFVQALNQDPDIAPVTAANVTVTDLGNGTVLLDVDADALTASLTLPVS